MNSNEQSREELRRSQARAKRRKTNLILNSLIGLVVLLIIIVSVSIFSGKDEEKGQLNEQAVEKSAAGSDSKQVAKNDSETATAASNNADEAKQKSDSKKSAEEKKAANEKEAEKEKADDEEKDAESAETVEEGGGPNVKRTITNPAWKPVESSQAQPYSSESTDWNERVQALSQAIGVDAGNMTIWYMGREGGSGSQSIGTVTAKDNPQQAYRVHLQWQDGAGWMPVRVEELIENDKD